MVILNSVKLAMVKINHHPMGFVRTRSSPCHILIVRHVAQ